MRFLGLIAIGTAVLLLEGIRQEFVIRNRKMALRRRAYAVVGYRGVR